MNVALFGATGGTGRQVLSQALDAGHRVTAVVRNPTALAIQHTNLEILRGDVLSPETAALAIAGKDAVVSALGANNRQPTQVYSAGLTNILAAMEASGVRRLVCVSASGLDPANFIQKIVARQGLWRLMKEGYTDLLKMENIVRSSDVDWTIIRPPQLTNGARTGRYQAAVNRQLTTAWQISRADLADYIIRHLNDPETYCAMVEVGY